MAKGDRTLTFSWISCCGPWCCHSPSSAPQPSVPPRPLQVNKSPCQMSSLLFFDIGQINSGQWTPQSTYIGRVLSFFSSRRNWDSSRRVFPLTLWFGRGGRVHGHTRLRERGWGTPNSDEGTYTVVLCVYKYFVVDTVSLRLFFVKIL